MLTIANIPPNILEWLADFENTLKAARPSEQFSAFVQLGVDIPGSCVCGDFGQDDWIHTHHASYNRKIWALLDQYDALSSLRRVCRRDIDAAGEKEYGKIVQKEYGESLLSFLTKRPDPKWFMVTAYVRHDCGCCTAEMLFHSEQRAQTALSQAELGNGVTIVDDAGTEHTRLDTFYGYSLVREQQEDKGLGYLMDAVVGG